MPMVLCDMLDKEEYPVEHALRHAYAECAMLTRKEAKNFYYGFITLPPLRKRAIYAVYSFCRVVDDAADLAPTVDEGRAKLAKLRQELAACLAGNPQGSIFTALADAQNRFAFNPAYLHAILDGVEQDLEITRYANFADLRDYCWKVASAVGLISLEIFGYKDPAAVQYAEDLGLAMQLTNILRDIQEDLERGRIYLPQDEMAKFGVTENTLRSGHVDTAFQGFMQYQVQRTRALFASGAKLAPLVAWSSRPCPLMLQAVYTRVLDQIEKANYDVFSRRLGPSGKEKLLILLRSWTKWLLFLPQ